MSQAGSTGKGGGAGAIITIAGDTGTISGNNVTIYADRAANNSGSSVGFDNSGTVSTLNVTDVNENTIIGNGAGNSTVSSDAPSNTGVGKEVLKSLTVGTENCAFGVGSLLFLTEGNTNVAVGFVNLENLVSGDANVALGNTVGQQLLTGSSNIMIGDHAGAEYDGAESNNILIGHEGVTGESNVIRIGTAGSGSGEQNAAFLAGVTGVTVPASAPAAVDTNGQLSSLGFGTATQVLTSNGAGNSPTWQAAGGGGNAAGFSVYLSGNVSNVTGDSTNYTVIFDTKALDTASAFNTGTGVYTFPYTGTWLLTGSFFLYNLGAAHTQLYAGITTTASSYNLYVANPYVMSAVGSTELQVPFSIMIQATATNTVYMTVEVVGGTKSVGLGGSSIGMTFSGVLLNT